jgi:hypothetical protein
MKLLAQAPAVSLGNEYAFGGVQSLGEGLGYLLTPMFQIAGLAVAIYFIMGSFKFLTSSGDPGKIKEGQQMIIHSVVGFVLLMMMFIILQFLPSYFGLNGFKLIKST